MLRFFLRRLIIIPVALVLVNFIGYTFAHVTFQLQQLQTAYGSGKEGITPVWPEYKSYIDGVLKGDFGKMPIGIDEPIAESLGKASVASLGLVSLTFVLSMILGLLLGLAAVRIDPPRTMQWLTFLSTVGLAMPSFYIGTLLVSAIILGMMNVNGEAFLPVAGFGWDQHLVLPLLALMIRPTMQIAQVSATLLSGELNKRYVVAARSFGHTWQSIRWDKALRNVLAPVILTMAGSFRMLMAELIMVEWLFSWPGLGRLLVLCLVPPNLAGIGGFQNISAYFLNPPLVAGLLVILSLLFLITDLLASGAAKIIDPRLRMEEEEPVHD